jgi:hypothetical protein
LASLLASAGLKRDVIPLVVVWGPGTEEMPTTASWEDGIGIVAGVHSANWLPGLRSSGRELSRDLAAEGAIKAFVERRDTYEARR